MWALGREERQRIEEEEQGKIEAEKEAKKLVAEAEEVCPFALV